jgi:hypothetical protein
MAGTRPGATGAVAAEIHSEDRRENEPWYEESLS